MVHLIIKTYFFEQCDENILIYQSLIARFFLIFETVCFFDKFPIFHNFASTVIYIKFQRFIANSD